MPKMEPMLASGTERSTPSSKHFTVSSASANSMRSFRSSNEKSVEAARSARRRPGHRPVRLPFSS